MRGPVVVISDDIDLFLTIEDAERYLTLLLIANP
jgi:hypothetical protein